MTLAAVVVCVAGCGPEPDPPPREPPPELPPPTLEQVYAPPDPNSLPRPYEIRRALRPDDLSDEEGTVIARRLVYRMRMQVHGNFEHREAGAPDARAELSLLYTRERLRARFEAGGWPLPEGAEIRIRRGAPGTFIFDDEGGRPWGPGELAHWFEGDSNGRNPFVRVRAPRQGSPGPIALVCRFIAEWANTSFNSISSQCREGPPPFFRVGLWFARLTADVSMDVPPSRMRADQGDPPRRPQRTDGELLVPQHLLARIWPATTPTFDPGPQPEGTATLIVHNDTPRRMIVIVDAVAIAWVARGKTLRIEGLSRGTHEVGAQRPFGHRAIPAVALTLPGEITFDR